VDRCVVPVQEKPFVPLMVTELGVGPAKKAIQMCPYCFHETHEFFPIEKCTKHKNSRQPKSTSKLARAVRTSMTSAMVGSMN